MLGIRRNRSGVVVLADLLSKIDGGRVCRLIRQDRKLRHTHVVALSPLSLEETKRYPELSADALVAKRQWKEAGQDILAAIEYPESGQLGLTSGIFGFNRFRPPQVPNDVLLSRRHYETLLRGFSWGVLELDVHWRILMANARATRLLSVRESNLIGTRLHDHVPDTDSHALEEAIRIAAKSANPEEQQLSVSLGPTASALTLRSNAANGRCSGFLVIID